ncbi:MAG: hypothetical protein HY925_03520 [Elusimicrobia bacterium]|nr:hypothetical protein [Elusimicrobiota bacterium]
MHALALASLILCAIPAAACLHGATGKANTTIVTGRQRTDRLVVTANAQSVVKIFVGPTGLAPGRGISGAALSDEDRVLHKQLSNLAASFAPALRSIGGAKSISFDGTAVTGEITALTEAHGWAEAREKAGLPESADDSRYEQWFAKAKSSGRGLYALKLSLNGESMPEIALKIDYADPGQIVLDKWLEAGAGLGTSTLIYFPQGDSKMLVRSVGQASGFKLEANEYYPGQFRGGGPFNGVVVKDVTMSEKPAGAVAYFAPGAGR